MKTSKSHFGDFYNFEMPKECDVVILAINRGFGLEPRQLLLPHQVYKEKIEKLNYGVVLIPASSKNYIILKEIP